MHPASPLSAPLAPIMTGPWDEGEGGRRERLTPGRTGVARGHGRVRRPNATRGQGGGPRPGAMRDHVDGRRPGVTLRGDPGFGRGACLTQNGLAAAARRHLRGRVA